MKKENTPTSMQEKKKSQKLKKKKKKKHHELTIKIIIRQQKTAHETYMIKTQRGKQVAHGVDRNGNKERSEI